MGGSRVCPSRSPSRNGRAGIFGDTLSSEVRGSELDTLATVVLAEKLGRSTYGGFAITMAGSRRHGEPASLSRRLCRATGSLPAGHHHWAADRGGRDDGTKCRLRSRKYAYYGAARRASLEIERFKDIHHQWCTRRHLLRCRQECSANRTGERLPATHLVLNFRDPAPPSPRGVLAYATPRRFPLRLITRNLSSGI